MDCINISADYGIHEQIVMLFRRSTVLSNEPRSENIFFLVNCSADRRLLMVRDQIHPILLRAFCA
jgi:hypothetical protein